MKKQTRTLIILAAVLVVVVAAYFGISAWNRSQDEAKTKAAEDSAIPLVRLTDVTSISLEYPDETLNFTKDVDGVWEYADDPAFPLDETLLVSLEGELSNLDALRSFDNQDGYSAYGLEEPAIRLTAETSSGGSFVLNIGNISGSGSGYYAYVQSDDLIYTVSEELVTSLSYTLMDMAAVETFPALTEENITSINLFLNGRILDITKDTQSDESDELTYTWYLQLDGESAEIPSDSSALQSMISELGALSFDSLYSYTADSETLASCSLDSPAYILTVGYEVGTMSLKLGGTNDKGNYYAMLDDSPYIYLLDSSLVEAIVTLDDNNIMLGTDDSEAPPS